MTALLVEDQREPLDCPYVWGDGYTRCTWHDLPVHRCLIQSGHDHACICFCGESPASPLPHPSRWQWVGYLDECLASWPNTLVQPCVKHNPTRRHMCVDGDPAVQLGHEPHQTYYHTCRCGQTYSTHESRRAGRDALYRYDPADLERS